MQSTDLEDSETASYMSSAPPEELLRLVYSSRLATDNKADADAALRHIVDVSRYNNARFGLTALLYCNTDSFNSVQVMEGPTAFVTKLFVQIAQDPRHTRVRRLLEQTFTPGPNTPRLTTSPCILATREQFEALRATLLASAGDTEGFDVKALDLSVIDSLPIAGDLDLSLFRLTYHSDFLTKEKQLAMQVMQNILEEAQRKNERLLIGGVLYLNTNTSDVFQCLEGPKNAVLSLYAEIQRDNRHANVETVMTEEPRHRRYRTWGMVWASKHDSKVLFESLPPNVISKIMRNRPT